MNDQSSETQQSTVQLKTIFGGSYFRCCSLTLTYAHTLTWTSLIGISKVVEVCVYVSWWPIEVYVHSCKCHVCVHMASVGVVRIHSIPSVPGDLLVLAVSIAAAERPLAEMSPTLSLFQAYQIMFHFWDACSVPSFPPSFHSRGFTCRNTEAVAGYPSHNHFKSSQHSFSAWPAVSCNLCLSKAAWFLWN